MLTSKFCVPHSAPAQMSPQQSFSVVCSRRNLRAFRCGDSSKGIVVNVCQLGIRNKIRGEQNLKSRAKERAL
jgi:hypothetical protein